MSILNSNDYIDYMQGLDKFDPRSANFVPRNTDSAGSESSNPLQGNP